MRLPAPPTLSNIPPSMVCALQYVQRMLLVAALWPSSKSNALYLFKGSQQTSSPGAPRRFGASAEVAGMRFFGGFTSAPKEPPCSGKIVLVVVMRAGFVLLAQFTTNNLNAPMEWSFPAADKLRAMPETAGWKSECVANADRGM